MDIFDFMAIKSLCGGWSGANPNIINSDNKKLGDLSNVAVGYKETNPGVVITWDGVTTGKDSITINGYSLYKVADYPTVTPQTVVLAGAVEGDVFENYTAQMFSIGDGNYICEELVFIMKAGIYEELEITVPSDGIYFVESNDIYVSQLTLEPPSETIHKIPTNYLELIDPNIIGSINKKLSDLPNVAVGYKETNNPGVVITWDGVTTGKDVIEDGSKKYYKVADYPTATLPQETTMEAITSTEETVTFNSQRSAYSSMDDAVYYNDFEHYSDAECIITTEGIHKFFEAPSDGVYFYKDENIYTSKFVLKEPSETIHPTPKIYQCTTEQFTIQTSAWSAINDKSPFTYKATVTAVSLNPSFAKTNLINNDAVAFANHRFAVGEISGQNITIYSVGQPSTSKNLIIDFYC